MYYMFLFQIVCLFLIIIMFFRKQTSENGDTVYKIFVIPEKYICIYLYEDIYAFK